MLDEIIITCALTGAGDGHKINPAVPVTPEEIAQEAINAARAGAAIAHIHVRDVTNGAQSMELKYYRETVDRIRSSGVDIIINLTTGPGARFTPSESDPRMATPDSTITSPEVRVEHILELKPELCSLDVATFNFGEHAFVNIPSHLARMAELVQSVGTKPEIEVFDLGHIRLAAEMSKKGLIKGKPLFQVCLGIPWGAPANVETMLHMRNSIPAGADWSAFGISHMQFPSVALAASMGGHVRVGLEDNLYMAKGELASGNAMLVERAVRIIESIGGKVASPQAARRILGLKQ